MHPVDLTPSSVGSLVVLLERGIAAGPGAIGAVKPDRWLCTVWACGLVRRREMLSDIIGRPPPQLELTYSLALYPEKWSQDPRPKPQGA